MDGLNFGRFHALSGALPLRKWQKEALGEFVDSRGKDFTVTATPGAGKTTFALTAARLLFDRKQVNRIVVVAPTDHMRRQWASAAAEAGLVLDIKAGNSGRLPAAADGYVTTYAQVAAKPALHERRATAAHRTLVIFDEIHHAGDGLAWGEAVRDAFDWAERRLCLTGTPFRTSNVERIPFVAYESDGDGGLRSTSDFVYDYADALADGVVRPVVFAAYSGVARWQNSAGQVFAADLQQPDSVKQEQDAWRAVLNPQGQWVRGVIEAAAAHLAGQKSSGVPDAACLVLASNQEQAREYAKVVKAVTGRAPTVVLSDDKSASDRIAAFNAGRGGDFLVAVRMVSEGVDIPRLTTLVWLTSHRTPLFFAQAVGRVVRARGGHETATVFLPSVRPLLRLASEMEQSRDHVVVAAAVEGGGGEDVDGGGFDSGGRPERASSALVEGSGSDARLVAALVGGRAIRTVSDGGGLTAEDEAFLGIPGLLTEEQTAMLLARREAERRRARPSVQVDSSGRQTVDQLRDEVGGLVKRWAARDRISVPEAHRRLMQHHPGPANSRAGLGLLQARRDWLLARTV